MSTRRIRVTGGETTVIELALPLSASHEVNTHEMTCHICANSLCDTGTCCRTGVHLACCTQLMCAKCVLHVCKRCRCDDRCKAVIGFCPYCRDISPVDPLDIFRGTVPECARCQRDNEESEPQDAVVIHGSDESDTSSTDQRDYFLQTM